MFKKVTKYFMAFFFVGIFTVTSFASSDLVDVASKMVLNGIVTPSYQWSFQDSYDLGTAFSTYLIENKENLSKCTDVSYYPIFKNNKIVAVLTKITGDNGSISYNFSKSFAQRIDEITQGGQKASKLILYGRQIFVYCDGNVFEIKCYDVPLFDQEDLTTDEVKNIVFNETLSFSQAENMTTTNKQALSVPQFSTLDSETMTLLLNVDTWQQPEGSNQCWAATAWCIGEYDWLNNHDDYLYSDPSAFAEGVGYTGTGGSDFPTTIEYIENEFSMLDNNEQLSIIRDLEWETVPSEIEEYLSKKEAEIKEAKNRMENLNNLFM